MTDTLPDSLLLTAAVEIQAAAQKTPRIDAVVYTGRTMLVSGFGNVAIDLRGLDTPVSVPVVADHATDLGNILGHATPDKSGGRLSARGEIIAENEATRQVLSLAKRGFKFQASVGVSPQEFRRIGQNETVTVNGNRLVGPFTLVTKGTLKEVSIVALGADGATTVNIAAAYSGIENMETTTTTDDPVAIERQRTSDILDICAGKHPDVQAKAIKDGWAPDRVRTEVLAEIRASRASTPGIAGGKVATDAKPRDLLAAAALMHLGRESLAEKSYGERVAQQARDLRCTSVIGLCERALTLEHRDIPSDRNEMIRAALSTLSLPTALGDSANKILLSAYTESPATWRAFANVKSANDFKDHTAIRPSAMDALTQVAKGGELKHTTITEGTYTYSVDTFGRMISLDRRDIVNDDLGVFNENGAAFGRSAARSVSDLVYSTIMANGGSFFSVGNANLDSGGSSVLAFDALSTAIAAVIAQRDGNGNDLDIVPKTLVVPPELTQTAKTLLDSDYIQQINTAGGPTGNPLKGSLSLVTEPRLSNTTRFASTASTTAWFVFASPNDAPVIVAFLNGSQAPVVEFFGFDAQVNMLSASWRVYFDYGCALGDYRAAYKSAGA